MLPALPASPVHYDATRRRLWICGQRCHHGATGALMAAAGAAGLVARKTPVLGAVMAAGTALMAHDWHDRQLWFRRGAQEV